MYYLSFNMSFTGGSDYKESACKIGDLGLIPGLGRSPGDLENITTLSVSEGSPWTKEADGLQSMGLQRVRHD